MCLYGKIRYNQGVVFIVYFLVGIKYALLWSRYGEMHHNKIHKWRIKCLI